MGVPTGYAAISIPLRHSLNPRAAYMTFGVEMNNASQALPDVVADVAAAFIATGSLRSQFDDNVTIGPIEGRSGGMANPAGGEFPEEAHVGTTGYPGTRGGSSTYSGVAVLIRKNTAFVGKHAKGRWFLPWFTGYANISEVGIIAASDVTIMQTKVNTFLNELNTRGVGLFLLHADETLAPYRVLTCTVDPLVSSQRRRYNRGG